MIPEGPRFHERSLRLPSTLSVDTDIFSLRGAWVRFDGLRSSLDRYRENLLAALSAATL